MISPPNRRQRRSDVVGKIIMAPKARPVPERFWSFVDSSDRNGCWLWIGYVNPVTGYGQFTIDRRSRSFPAHRFAWLLSFARMPGELLVCHTCDNRRCVRPAHLFLGTHQDNADDMIAKGRSATGDKNGSRTRPERLKRGDEHPSVLQPERYRTRAVINEAIASRIKGMRNAGLRICEIARVAGCADNIVYNVLTGKAYKNAQPVAWES